MIAIVLLVVTIVSFFTFGGNVFLVSFVTLGLYLLGVALYDKITGKW